MRDCDLNSGGSVKQIYGLLTAVDRALSELNEIRASLLGMSSDELKVIEDESSALRLIRTKQVAEMLGVSVTTLWRIRKNDPDFPAPVVDRDRSKKWAHGDVIAYLSRQRQNQCEKKELAALLDQ